MVAILTPGETTNYPKKIRHFDESRRLPETSRLAVRNRSASPIEGVSGMAKKGVSGWRLDPSSLKAFVTNVWRQIASLVFAAALSL
jgi:hypothetical protein